MDREEELATAAETPAQPDFGVIELPVTTAEGLVVGAAAGLLWEDQSGYDVIGVYVQDVQVAVPVAHDEWRIGPAIELPITEDTLDQAPRVQDLEASDGPQAISAVSEFFSVQLSGPPPGPPLVPLPPWWPMQRPPDASGGPVPAPAGD